MTDLVEHHIDMQGAPPVRHKFRRMSPKMLEIAQKEVENLSERGIIEQSASDWRSVPVMIRKSDGSWHFCRDYRDVNKCLKKDAYLIPNMDSILDELRNARYISKIDLRAAYFQVPIERSSRRYTAFTLHGSGLWQFTRMPFGLANAPAT